MSAALLVVVVLAAWAGIGLVVALFLGRLFRDTGPVTEETADRLVC